MAKKAAKKKTARKKAPARKKNQNVYFFGGKKSDGDGSQKALLGGKGANLAEMSNIGLPVPAGMTITTEVCTHYYANKLTYPKTLDAEIKANITKIEKVMGKKFGDLENPLLL
jgi:pyruvate,orthophosphate dikinase